jgi:hypothetical protein
MFPAKALYVALRIGAGSGETSQGPADFPGQGPVGDQVWSVFSRASRRAQQEWDELTARQSALESTISELRREADELRAQRSDL